ncbi:hypothetical protein Ciccas_000279 [Cichlidogyrus casuarinus]|uniref:Uncharacterized protein n=1 Tax=Cichlidogyrus casuarinus TaxID=1844966 RepID=A0ABD2QNC3_9PLAT
MDMFLPEYILSDYPSFKCKKFHRCEHNLRDPMICAPRISKIPIRKTDAAMRKEASTQFDDSKVNSIDDNLKPDLNEFRDEVHTELKAMKSILQDLYAHNPVKEQIDDESSKIPQTELISGNIREFIGSEKPATENQDKFFIQAEQLLNQMSLRRKNLNKNLSLVTNRYQPNQKISDFYSNDLAIREKARIANLVNQYMKKMPKMTPRLRSAQKTGSKPEIFSAKLTHYKFPHASKTSLLLETESLSPPKPQIVALNYSKKSHSIEHKPVMIDELVAVSDADSDGTYSVEKEICERIPLNNNKLHENVQVQDITYHHHHYHHHDQNKEAKKTEKPEESPCSIRELIKEIIPPTNKDKEQPFSLEFVDQIAETIASKLLKQMQINQPDESKPPLKGQDAEVQVRTDFSEPNTRKSIIFESPAESFVHPSPPRDAFKRIDLNEISSVTSSDATTDLNDFSDGQWLIDVSEGEMPKNPVSKETRDKIIQNYGTIPKENSSLSSTVETGEMKLCPYSLVYPWEDPTIATLANQEKANKQLMALTSDDRNVVSGMIADLKKVREVILETAASNSEDPEDAPISYEEDFMEAEPIESSTNLLSTGKILLDVFKTEHEEDGEKTIEEVEGAREEEEESLAGSSFSF